VHFRPCSKHGADELKLNPGKRMTAYTALVGFGMPFIRATGFIR
jgi:hypothetical protein